LVFVAADGGMLRRSNFARRIWRPACDGTPDHGDPGRAIPPILPGAVFHGLRHHHKTMLDELDVPEVLVCERMGHRMKGIGGRYKPRHPSDAAPSDRRPATALDHPGQPRDETTHDR
jgi:integrase